MGSDSDVPKRERLEIGPLGIFALLGLMERDNPGKVRLWEAKDNGEEGHSEGLRSTDNEAKEL